MTDHIKKLMTLFSCVGLLVLSGCFGGRSDLGQVTGTVTIDGEPINYASVTFMPTQGRASIGLTDLNGVYNLVYVIGENGALIGNHKVIVTTKVVKETEYGGRSGGIKDPVRQTGRKELLPKENSDRNHTELTATVESGNNTINFDLTSKKKK
jgi:hypothetical protein